METFKIARGNSNNIATPKAINKKIYFTQDDGKIYIDIAGDGTTDAIIGTNRLFLNSQKGDKLTNKRNITLSGALTGNGEFDGSSDLNIDTILNLPENKGFELLWQNANATSSLPSSNSNSSTALTALDGIVSNYNFLLIILQTNANNDSYYTGFPKYVPVLIGTDGKSYTYDYPLIIDTSGNQACGMRGFRVSYNTSTSKYQLKIFPCIEIVAYGSNRGNVASSGESTKKWRRQNNMFVPAYIYGIR